MRSVAVGVSLRFCVCVQPVPLVVAWYFSRTTASPGPVLPVPAASGKTSAGEGTFLHLSMSQADKLRKGQTVTIEVPGGKIVAQPAKSGGQVPRQIAVDLAEGAHGVELI